MTVVNIGRRRKKFQWIVASTVMQHDTKDIQRHISKLLYQDEKLGTTFGDFFFGGGDLACRFQSISRVLW
jgi:hypothetical protein